MQTIMFGILGRVGATKVLGRRYSLRADDGSDVYYDVFEPNISEEEKLAREKEIGTASPITFFAIPGKLELIMNMQIVGVGLACANYSYCTR